MRSGNGRHRRPRQAPAIVVAAGVTGAGLALPLLTAGGAQAADGATWDKVAECESGGLWSANAGNGYYGGLQLTLETWEEYGGTALAARPDLASRGQQIDIAEKILAEEGPEAWPSCSISSGLHLDDTDLDVPDVPDVPDAELPDVPDPDVPDVPDPDVPEAPELPDAPGGSTEDPADGGSSEDGSNGDGSPEGTDGGGSPEGSNGNSPDGSGGGGSGDGGSGDGSAEQDPTPTPGGTSGTGSGIGEPSQTIPEGPDADAPDADLPDTDLPDTDRPDAEKPDAGGGATGDDGTGRHRGTPDDRPRDEADRPSRGKHGKPGESGNTDAYRVRAGDSLSAIAAERDVQGGWSALYEANETTIGDDPDLIMPGQLLDLRTGGELR